MSAFDDWAKTVAGINLNDFDRMTFNAGMTRAESECRKILLAAKKNGGKVSFIANGANRCVKDIIKARDGE